jgi:hypothetical protein
MKNILTLNNSFEFDIQKNLKILQNGFLHIEAQKNYKLKLLFFK